MSTQYETPTLITPEKDGSNRAESSGILPPELTLSAIRKVFDRAPVGVIQIDTQFNILYANGTAIEMVGAEGREHLNLLELVDAENKAKLEERFTQRLAGQSGQYELDLLNLATNRKLPTCIAATPITDASGQVLGSFAIVRNNAFERALRGFDEAITRAHNRGEVFLGIAKELKKILPYDWCNVYAYNDDNTKARIIFEDPEPAAKWPMRWFDLNSELAASSRETNVLMVNDLAAYLRERNYDMQTSASAPAPIDLSHASLMRWPVVFSGHVVASLAIYRKGKNAFSENERSLLERLPVDRAVVTAEYLDKLDESTFRDALLSELMNSTQLELFNDHVAQIIVDRLAQRLDLDNIAIFGIDTERQLFRLAAQSARGCVFPEGYTQPMDEGILHWVVVHETSAVSQDVHEDENFKNIYKTISTETRSELCMRILQGGRLVGILTIEDSRKNAFSAEEQKVLQDLLGSISDLLERRYTQNLVNATFQCTPSAVLAVCSDGTIGKRNPAATELLGYSEEEFRGKPLRELFVEPDVADVVVRAKAATSADIALKRKDGSQVKVMLGGSRMLDQSGTVISCRDMSTHLRGEQLEFLNKVFYELAAQTKPPLALAFEWIRQLREVLAKEQREKECVSIDKIIRQLRKVQLTYDRLAAYQEKEKPTPANKIVLNARHLLESIVGDFPQGEASQVKIGWNAPEAFIKVDPSQIAFTLETTLAYLLHLLPQDQTLNVQVGNRDLGGSQALSIVIDARIPTAPPSETDPDELELTRVKSDLSFGLSHVEQFAKENGGWFNHYEDGNNRRFEFVFPVMGRAA